MSERATVSLNNNIEETTQTNPFYSDFLWVYCCVLYLNNVEHIVKSLWMWWVILQNLDMLELYDIINMIIHIMASMISFFQTGLCLSDSYFLFIFHRVYYYAWTHLGVIGSEI